MKNIYFIINNHGNHQNIINSGSGASEFLFYLTAYKLSSLYNITIFNRDNPNKIDNIEYKFLPNNMNPDIENINDSIIIVQRHFNILIDLHKINPSNKYILWSHDFLQNNFTNLSNNYNPHEINDYFYNASKKRAFFLAGLGDCIDKKGKDTFCVYPIIVYDKYNNKLRISDRIFGSCSDKAEIPNLASLDPLAQGNQNGQNNQNLVI